MAKTDINIGGHQALLVYTCNSLKDHHAHPLVIYKGKPVYSLDVDFGVPTKESLDNASKVIDSFIKNDGKYSILPDSSYQQMETIDENVFKQGRYSLDIYTLDGVRHMVVETKNPKDTFVKFCIWDRDLSETIYNLTVKHQTTRSSHFYDSFDDFYNQ